MSPKSVYHDLVLTLPVFIAMLMACSKATDPPDGTLSLDLIPPARGGVVSGIVTVVASHSGSENVTAVEFYIDGQLHLVDSERPWSFDWDTRGLAGDQMHIVWARAIDPSGNVVNSSELRVNVSTIVIPEEPGDLDAYEGTYTVILDYASIHQETLMNFVEWTFDTVGNTYHMRIDSDHNTGVCFCEVSGQFVLLESLRLAEMSSQSDTAAGCVNCDTSHNPSGTFIRESLWEQLVFKQLVGTVYKELRLTRAGGSQ